MQNVLNLLKMGLLGALSQILKEERLYLTKLLLFYNHA